MLIVCLFKQQTAYEMRISDWSADVCSSDLHIDVSLFDTQLQSLANVASSVCFTGEDARRYGNAHASIVPYQSFHASDGDFVLAVASDRLWPQLCESLAQPQRSEERRVGNEGFRTCKSRWSQVNKKKKKN